MSAEGWHQTMRLWGNGSIIRGVQHFFIGERAICGYRPHEWTRLRAVAADERVPSCERCAMNADRYGAQS